MGTDSGDYPRRDPSKQLLESDPFLLFGMAVYRFTSRGRRHSLFRSRAAVALFMESCRV